MWAGMNSWAMYRPMAPISTGEDEAATPYVTTNAGKQPRRQLTSGSTLNKPATGPWPPIIDAGLIDFKAGTAWAPNGYRTVQVNKSPANYGDETSVANFGFRHWAFPIDPANGEWSSIGMLPGPDPSGRRPMWNNLTKSHTWNQRVLNPTNTKNGELATINANKYSMAGGAYNNPASLNASGTQQGEVLL
jgi:hypothetical protein